MHERCNTASQPYVPRRQYGELTLSEEIVWAEVFTALEKLNSRLHNRLSRHKCFTLLSWVLHGGVYANA